MVDRRKKMKTIRNIIFGIIFTLALFSCDNPVNLGTRLDLSGPVINFTSPVPRKAVTAEFVLEGTAEDDSGVKTLLVKVERNRVELQRQWRYSKGGWEISENHGVNWKPLAGGVWNGDTYVVWSIPISLTINGIQPEDGEYLFSATAWDSGSVSDDNSFKTLVLIIDNDPPNVNVINPLLFSRYIAYNPATDKFDDTELEELRSLSDWRNPEYIGKFLTNSFTLQWSIEDNFNIWSFDLRFYDLSVTIDSNPETPLPDDYIYRFHQNLPPVPVSPSPENYVKPNGSVIIPALDETAVNIDGNAELKKQVNDKTTIRVVGVCYDAANNVTQEKTLGYFVYWPQADIPWISFSGGIKPPEDYDTTPGFDVLVDDAFLVYPGRDIKAIAFHAQGVKEVTFSLYKIEPAATLADSVITLLPEYNNRKITNPPRGTNIYSTNFSWDFRPPPRSAFYIVEAQALSVSGKKNTVAKAVFKVQDISFPDFPTPIKPPALDPFFKYIDIVRDSLTISGIVSDATRVDSLCLVWINPKSKDYYAQRQLAYFKDPKYAGWLTALNQTAGGTWADEDGFDVGNPNKVWRLAPVISSYPDGINPDTQRVEYDFSLEIPLSDMNIGIGKESLKSQVFLLRAENPDNRVTIITYTPQGDEAPPVIEIKNVFINSTTELTPGEFGEIEKFKDNDEVTINGTWKEDSIKYLNFDNYLKGNFMVSINQTELTSLTFTTNPAPNNDSGTWQAKAKVKQTTTAANDVPLSLLKDTLVISANLKDIGGNVSDDGASWLIKSDTLRLVRISSELADQTYNSGDIDIFIEFNKPVVLKTGRSANPVLTLKVGSGTATAAYTVNPTQSTRQYFKYTVKPGDNAMDPNWLDVSGLSYSITGNYWQDPGYPFTWESESGTGAKEEIRVTMNTAHTDGTQDTVNNYYLRRLPVAAITEESMYTLAKGKNIGIDTTAPSVASLNSSNKAGHYALGSEIIINAVFNEPVKISSPVPQIILQVFNFNGTSVTNTTVTTDGSVKVNDKTVTFSYTVKANETTGDKKLIVTAFTGGIITDLAGNSMATLSLSEPSRTLNGGSDNSGTGIFINTIAPAVPVFRALTGNNNTAIIKNTINTQEITGESGSADKDLKNYYGDALWFAVTGNTNTIHNDISTTGNERLGSLEYSLDALTTSPPVNWKKIETASGTPFQQSIYGKYVVRVRQIDKAGNPSAASKGITINWDPGTLVSRIDSSSPNGTYTNTTGNITPPRTDSVNITVYFRKKITITGTPVITLNAIRGTNTVITVNGATASDTDTLSFTYTVQNTDNTPTGQYLDVTNLNITARDAAAAADGVVVTDFIKLPAVENRLNNRKDILVQTTALALQGNPVYSFTSANDQATGTITLTFNRSIIKKGGSITVTQQDTGYRLPAVLTEAQAAKYKEVPNFDTYYKKGTNGFSNGASDTSTKYVLDYTDTTVVTPANTTGMAKFAYDFRSAESVSLPVTSQDITVNASNDKQLIIKIEGSNALQVLGATYDFAIPVGLVQDSLGYQWPTTAQNYNDTNNMPAITTAGINRPFVRIDKKISEDRITSETASATMPHLRANFDRLLQTRARLDCRTPSSIVRYNATGQAYEATEATTSYNRNGQNWRNGGSLANANNLDAADRFDYLTQPALQETGTGGTNYTDFTTHITVGTNSENGYVWRVSVRSRNSTTGNTNSDLFEEIAFRTVLTYQLDGLTGNTVGQNLSQGDQLWVRGGDAISSSSVPGFPLTWSDDYNAVRNENRRAGVRLLRRVSATTNVNTTSVWRWITWEINVRTWHDVVLGRGTGANTVAQGVNDAWQFGPVQWAYPRGGWVALKDDYTLYPGKHRWMRISNDGSYAPGGTVNYSLEMNRRIDPGANTITMPPAP
jgi:hypothetical protein